MILDFPESFQVSRALFMQSSGNCAVLSTTVLKTAQVSMCSWEGGRITEVRVKLLDLDSSIFLTACVRNELLFYCK